MRLDERLSNTRHALGRQLRRPDESQRHLAKSTDETGANLVTITVAS